jgi:phosphoglycolate phosphatase
MPPSSGPLLVLWDVDYTLLHTGGAGREWSLAALAEVVGRPVRFGNISGRTEKAIVYGVLRELGIEPTPDHVRRYAQVLAARYGRDAAELVSRGGVLAGVREVLAALAGHPEVVQTLVTGNVPAVATAKLRAFGLSEHLNLEVAAYGGEHEDRAELVRLARRRAGMAAGDGRDTVVVGDTVNDVVAARAAGVRVLAVASGATTVDELAAAGADRVLPDLADTPVVLDALLGRDR